VLGVEEVVKYGFLGGLVVVLWWCRAVFKWSCGGDWVVVRR
jgi:hypothetical protein